MAAVVICYARDGEAIASRLAGALAAEGFRIWTEEGAGAPITDRVDEVQAAVVVWSAAARLSDWTRAEANYARGQKKLVQVSIDRDPPPLPFDAKSATSLADWSGEADHSGWQKVKAEVMALAPVPRPAMAAPAVAAPAHPPRRRPPPPPRRRRGLGLALVLIALAAALAAFFWMRSGPPFGRQPAPIPLPKAATEPQIRELPELFPPPEDAPAGNEVAPVLEEEPPVEPAAEPPAEARPETRPEARPVPRPSGPRINRRNSENMRLFCERAGRGTAQCRAFQRQLRNQQR